MPNIPTPIRAALGLAATAVDEARKLPETLPHAVSAVPLRAVSTAMQASLKLQQHLATLSARGDEVLSQLRGRSAEPPSWATFDESPAHTGAVDAQAGKAPFDRIDYDSTGFAERLADDDTRNRWDAVGVGGTQPESEPTTRNTAAADFDAAGSDGGVTAPPPSAVEPAPPAPSLADALSTPDLPVGTAAPAKDPAKTPAKAAKKAAKAASAKATGTKASPTKASPTKASPGKISPAKDSPAKAGPAKAKRAARKAEPLEVAASKAPSDGAPTPSTMAAEILHAHEASSDDE